MDRAAVIANADESVQVFLERAAVISLGLTAKRRLFA
jgi:hypothetical protein